MKTAMLAERGVGQFFIQPEVLWALWMEALLSTARAAVFTAPWVLAGWALYSLLTFIVG